VVFGNPSGISNTYALEGLTDAGQVLFTTRISGLVPPLTRGLFLSEPDGRLHTVLRTRDVVDLAGDGRDVRTVAETAPPTTTTTTLPTRRSRYTSKKLSVAGTTALAATNCHTRAVSKWIALDPECLPKADAKFSEGWGKAEAAGDCLAPTGDAKAVAAQVVAFLDDVITGLVNALGPSTCTSRSSPWLAGRRRLA